MGYSLTTKALFSDSTVHPLPCSPDRCEPNQRGWTGLQQGNLVFEPPDGGLRPSPEHYGQFVPVGLVGRQKQSRTAATPRVLAAPVRTDRPNHRPIAVIPTRPRGSTSCLAGFSDSSDHRVRRRGIARVSH